MRRIAKENQILDAAERIFSEIGFRNTRMEDIAREIGMSKGSVYFYFESKENLYMAVTYRAFEELIRGYKACSASTKDENGKTAVVELFRYHLDFCENQPGYYALLMNYMSLARAEEEKNADMALSEAMRDSTYFRKIRNLRDLPLEIVVSEIVRGQEDGSIRNKKHPHLLYLSAWAQVAGFTEIRSTSRKNRKSTVLNVSVAEWREYTFELMSRVLDDLAA
ncbi:MAG: TetR/AcrR family transcriptional regulator [Bacteroidetes bacterium]|nr:TetR/AcrR family transcriptional regulator [Bacteroidota bacterium]